MHRPLLLSLLLAALAPAAASATTFCVDAPAGCSGTQLSGAAAAESSALTGPHRKDGAADEVVFAPGVYADPATWQPGGTDDLVVRGAGAETVLTSSKSVGTNIFVFDTGFNTPIAIRDLTIRVPAGFQDDTGGALQAFHATVERVRLESQNPGADAVPSSGDSVFRAVVVDGAAGGTFRTGFRQDSDLGGALVIDRSHVRAFRAVESADTAASTLVRRSVLQATGVAAPVEAFRGKIRLENSLVAAKDGPGLQATTVDGESGEVEADHVTAVDLDGGGVPAVRAVVLEGAAGDATVRVRNSVLWGFPHAGQYLGGDEPGEGDGLVAIRYSNVSAGGILTSGSGNQVSQFNRTGDPGFAEGGGFRLAAGSPVIDAGDPALGGPAEDFDAHARVLDGDGDGTARRDMGAFEFDPAPKAAGPADPDPGPDPSPAPGGAGGGTDGPAPAPQAGGPTPAPQPAPLPLRFGPHPLVFFERPRVDRSGRIVLVVVNANRFIVNARLVLRRKGTRRALARTTFHVTQVARRNVRIRLTRAGRRALRRPGRLRARLVLTAVSPAGDRRVVERTVTIGSAD